LVFCSVSGLWHRQLVRFPTSRLPGLLPVAGAVFFSAARRIFTRQPARIGAQLPAHRPGCGPGFSLPCLIYASSARAQGAPPAARFLARALFPASIRCSGFLFLLLDFQPDSSCHAGQSISSDFLTSSHPPRFPSGLRQFVLRRCLPDFLLLHFCQ
jgi:hypothetical protein